MRSFFLGIAAGFMMMGLMLGGLTANMQSARPVTPAETMPNPPPGVAAGAPIRSESCNNFDFRFFVTLDWQMSENVRKLEVFLDPSAFNENNLKDLFSYLSRKNPDSKILIIEVETEWKRMPVANACPSGDSELPLDPKRNDFHVATFRRGGKHAQFKYNPVLKTDARMTVTMEPGTF